MSPLKNLNIKKIIAKAASPVNGAVMKGANYALKKSAPGGKKINPNFEVLKIKIYVLSESAINTIPFKTGMNWH